MASRRPGPGPVAAAHRLLIVTALLSALAYTVWEFLGYARDGDRLALLRAALALAVTVAIGAYFRSLRGRLAEKLTPPAGP